MFRRHGWGSILCALHWCTSKAHLDATRLRKAPYSGLKPGIGPRVGGSMTSSIDGGWKWKSNRDSGWKDVEVTYCQGDADHTPECYKTIGAAACALIDDASKNKMFQVALHMSSYENFFTNPAWRHSEPTSGNSSYLRHYMYGSRGLSNFCRIEARLDPRTI